MSHRPSRFKSDLNFAIEEKLREAGIEIPFPQRDLHIRSGSVRVEEGGTEHESPSSPDARSLQSKREPMVHGEQGSERPQEKRDER
jgi:small-conductance mechanosensitive channel